MDRVLDPRNDRRRAAICREKGTGDDASRATDSEGSARHRTDVAGREVVTESATRTEIAASRHTSPRTSENSETARDLRRPALDHADRPQIRNLARRGFGSWPGVGRSAFALKPAAARAAIPTAAPCTTADMPAKRRRALDATPKSWRFSLAGPERAEEDPLAELLEVLPQRLSRCGELRPRQRRRPDPGGPSPARPARRSVRPARRYSEPPAG